MHDSDCVQFMAWALPRMGLRASAFRRVRRQVCRRIAARVRELGLTDCRTYAAYLERNAVEWEALEALCGITISRFYRDHGVFDALAERVLPDLAGRAGTPATLRVWSAGCASGEEPYTLALIWEMLLAVRYPGVDLRVLATDRDAGLLARAKRGCYRRSSLRELPSDWPERAFQPIADEWCLQPGLRRAVAFEQQDIRRELPEGPFQLILCRNLVFSYFSDPEQRRVLHGLVERLTQDGYLVVGAGEALPDGESTLRRDAAEPCIYRRPS